MDIADYNRRAWDHQVKQGNRWTVPVTVEQVAAAKQGDWEVLLTPQKPVPRNWFPTIDGLDLLGLASGGGQQAPIFSAAGANVTVLDNSPGQLEQDQKIARRDGLQIRSIQGDMRDLSQFPNESFDLVFNPCSVAFIPDVAPVFSESFRVLRPGGRLMCGFVNPVRYIFDEQKLETGQFLVRHKLPYADTTHLTSEELQQFYDSNEPLMFSHSLEEMIAGQLHAELTLCDLYEDHSSDDSISDYLPVYFATLAKKP